MSELGIAIEEDHEDESGGESLSEEAKPRKSMRKAINDKCRECIYDDCAPGNWRQQTGACTVITCPLYEFRPVSKSRKSEDIVE